MAKLIMPPAEFEGSRALDSSDELLTADELKGISLFQSLKTKMPFEKFPSFTILRKCTPGRVLCEQAEGGYTAFCILTTEDVLGVRQTQLESLRQFITSRKEGNIASESLQSLFRDTSDRELIQRKKLSLLKLKSFRVEFKKCRMRMKEVRSVIGR